MNMRILNIILGTLVILFVSISIDSAIVDDLFSKLDIEDKCGQMTQVALDVVSKPVPVKDRPTTVPIDYEKLLKYIKDYKVGSILNTLGATANVVDAPTALTQPKLVWHGIIKLIHDVVRNSTQHKIPVLYGVDSIHGANYIDEGTLFPQPISMAATFNLDIAEKIGRITSVETRAVGIPWNFNPVLDVGRHPLWSRLFETYGEDTYLGVKMGAAYIKGHQGDNDLTKKENTATCLKHFIGYSFPFNGQDRTPAYIPENLLREVFLPPFEAGVKAGSPTVMINSGEVNGIPGHANSYYINEILKGELKFEGFVVSDWEDIIRLYTRDGLAETPEDAVRIAVMAGLDMSMVPYDASFYEHCVNLSKKDSKFLERVNDATRRILRVKNQLGLLGDYDKIYPDQTDLNKIGTEESEKFNLDAARESIILVKNEKNTLPLDKTSDKRILITGPTANLRKVLNGGWSYTWQGNSEQSFDFGREKLTLKNALQKKYNNLVYMEGASLNNLTNIEETIEEAKRSDIIILAIGEDAYAETPGNIYNMMLPDHQYTLAKRLFELNKPVIVVYFGGRPRIITDIDQKASAVIIGLLPGNRGGEAVSDVIFNDYNPNGRLPITYPKTPYGFITYDYKPLENFDVNKPQNQILYSFGHGLSYTSFEYSNLKLDKLNIDDDNDAKLSLSVDVKNVGKYEGKVSVLLFVKDEVGSVSRPVKQLKGFKKINLKPGDMQTVNFVLNVHDDLSFIGINNKRIVEPGYFKVYVDKLEARFSYKVKLDKNGTNILSINNIIMIFCIIFQFVFLHLSLKNN